LAVFIPVKFDTAFFYIGLTIFIIGMVLYEFASIHFARTPIGESATVGLYKYSRDPIYLFNNIIWLGVGVLTGSWFVII